MNKDVNFEGKIASCGHPSTILTTIREHLKNHSQVQDIKTLNPEELTSVSYNSESRESESECECIFRKKKLLQNFTKEKSKKKLARKMRKRGR